MHAIGPAPDPSKLGEWSLVLRSQAILHGITRRDDGLYVTVHDRDAARSVDAINAYEEENRDFRPRAPVRERLPFGRSSVGVLSMALVALFFLVTGPVADRSAWFRLGTADAARILQGEPWRAVTALTLHADAAHVAGNVLSGAIFLSLLARRLGAGRAIFLTVVAGALANLGNAALHAFVIGTGHRSIGASTAVFAAVGLLAATQIVVNRTTEGPRRWTDSFAPVVGGLTILGLLGSAAHSDLWAHGLGLVAGALVGLAVLLPRRGRVPVGRVGQRLLGALAASLVVGAWIVAIVTRGLPV
jgi:membrane associated rhomboid family serine protease